MRRTPPGFTALLAMLPVAPPVRADLRRRMSARSRHYHGASHLALMWQRHHRFGAGSALATPRWDRLLACAIAFHDAVYDARRHDNEAASARLWRLARPRLDRQAIAWVEATILATADHLGARPAPGMTRQAWAARQWLLDLDLAPLGEPPAGFARNTRALRREYAHLSTPDWEAGRQAFLRRIAAVPVLYRSPRLARVFGPAARSNFARELGHPPPG